MGQLMALSGSSSVGGLSRSVRANSPIIDRRTAFEAPAPKRAPPKARVRRAEPHLNRISAVAVAAVMFGSFMAVLLSYTGPAASYAYHAPIEIYGDGDFTPANGVTGGDGSVSDPYVISGWEICGDAATGCGIYVESTTSFFEIRDVHINSTSSGDVMETAIWLTEVSNATVESCLINYTTYGVYVDYSENVTMRSNTIDDCSYPVTLDVADCCEVLNNTITDGWVGIALSTVSFSEIDGNDLDVLEYEGVKSVFCYSCIYSNNEISNCSGSAIFMSWDCSDCTIHDNTLTDNSDILYDRAGGVFLDGCTGMLVYRNCFYGNTPAHAYDFGVTGNSWNLAAPVGGNYWDDYGGVDSDSDGFGDTSYAVGGGAQDSLPLMAPPGSEVPIPEFSSVVVPVLAVMALFLVVFRRRTA